MKRIRRTPRGNRCDKSQDSQGILLFVLKRGKIAISRQPLLPKLLKQLEESLARFLQACTNSLIVCAGCVGISGSV